MARREQWSVRELSYDLGGGNRAGVQQKLLNKVLRVYKCTPAAKVADRFVTSTNMINGAYTIVNSGLPGDGLAHNVTVAHATVATGTDTLGTLLVTGLDIDGRTITETITPLRDNTVQGIKAFKQVVSIVGSGWVIAGGNDTILMGFGDFQGFPECIVAATDILLAAFNTAILNAPTVTVDANVISKNGIGPAGVVGDATSELKVIYQV